jgi:hypothetical protein
MKKTKQLLQFCCLFLASLVISKVSLRRNNKQAQRQASVLKWPYTQTLLQNRNMVIF